DALRLLRRTRGVPVFLFGTMGGNPGDERSRAFLAKKLAELREEGVRVESLRMFQGRIDPAVIERMNRTQPMTEERRARLEEAARHPDEADFEAARAWARDCFEGVGEKRSA
ncbi:MAG: flavodoxin family protein, partial [Sutterellaceae bacterium]|nr:flavodoxin family protein [Sutterellaceae bacterium]